MEQWHGKVVRITRDPLDDALAHCRAVMARGSVDASYAYPHQASHCDPHAARPDSHPPGAWPEPYDPAGDADSDTGSLNAGLDRLGDHHQGPGGFGRVDRAQSMDRARRDVPPDGREPVRDPDREAADAMTREAQERGEYDAEMDMVMPVTPFSEQRLQPLSSIPGLIEQIRKERDDWKSRAEAAERKLTDRAQCCVENEERVRVRDARVEPPPPGSTVLVWDGQAWMPDDADWPIRYARTGVHSRYWLPMPPAPEEKP